jgi:hypothetical protein
VPDDAIQFLDAIEKLAPSILDGSAERDLLAAEALFAIGRDKDGVASALKAARAGGRIGADADRLVLSMARKTTDLTRLLPDALAAAARAAFAERSREGYTLCVSLNEHVIRMLGAGSAQPESREAVAFAWYRTGLSRWRLRDHAAAANALSSAYRLLQDAPRGDARGVIARAWLAVLRELAENAPGDEGLRAAYEAARDLVLRPPAPASRRGSR